MQTTTRQKLLIAGMPLLLERGYNDFGINDVLKATGTPKGSFYHHFESKEAFALGIIELYMEAVHAGLDACLDDATRTPLNRVRHFFELSRDKYRDEGYFGCLLGGVGQELSGANPVFREKIEECFAYIGNRMARCLEAAKTTGELDASADTDHLAELLIDCWEGAALRSRLRRSPQPLDDMLEFYFSHIAAA